jgi:hypothetical protein
MAPLNEHPLDLTERGGELRATCLSFGRIRVEILERFRESLKGLFVDRELLKKGERCANSTRVPNVFRPGPANGVLECAEAAVDQATIKTACVGRHTRKSIDLRGVHSD